MKPIVNNTLSETKAGSTSAGGYAELFEEQARQTPNGIAVCFEEQALSYGELNRRANQLASFLLKKGAKQQQTIGLYMRRSIDSIAGFLAILKAGCVYLPLSLKYPPRRLKYIAEDAHISVFLTQENSKEIIKDIDIPQICIDSEWDSISKEDDKNHENDYNPELLVYMIYTSGTTGNPKGVKVKYESLMNFYDAMNEIIFNDSEKRHYNLGFYSSLDFDMSFKQLLQLLNGHTLHIIPEEMRMDLNWIKNFIENKEIHVFDCPTPVIKVLCHLGLLLNKKHKLKKVLFGGESIDAATWKIMAKEKTIDFYNMYGPTECTIDATITRVNSEDEIPHIGKPVLNTEVYILDENMKEVSGSNPGEIHVGGKCLAQGYQGNDALTNEKFIYTSVGSKKNVRLYKTGDLARYLPDGAIEYIGRIDRQVKIRGYRIEIKEIEAVIRQYDGINDVIVKAIENSISNDISNRVLAAYLLLKDNVKLDIDAIKKFLLNQLPEYMIPSAFLIIESIPLTNNGKTDYDALPMPDWSTTQSASEKTSGELSSLEKYIIDVWKKTLGIENINAADNFFEKGGHSLFAMQITAELQEYFDTDIPLISLFFEGPTVKDFAKAIEENLERPDELEDILAEISGNKK